VDRRPDQARRRLTTRAQQRVQDGDSEKSASFIGAPSVWTCLGGPDDAGEGVIVAGTGCS